ncbi:MAG: hypothetical protein FWC28_04635 [Proteobacteria bacterium]|nr:hypothetical protein [Cystobacterineae bacterium]MCL2314522.1 hypothetical protein [Pseudomonadota bacterium]
MAAHEGGEAAWGLRFDFRFGASREWIEAIWGWRLQTSNQNVQEGFF